MPTTRFFYFYDTTGEHRRPMVTICRIRTDEGEYAYGWAVCSERDLPCKRIGRAIAQGRALAALGHKKWLHSPSVEQSAWLHPHLICRAEALATLRRCKMLAKEISYFSQDTLFSLLPKSMQP